MKSYVLCDHYKLPIFRKALDDAGFGYKEKPGLPKGSTLFTIKTDEISKLTQVAKFANEKAILECCQPKPK